MRKLKLQVQMSVDGFIAGPRGEMDWMMWNWDDRLKAFVNQITTPVDTIILGRKLAEGFIPAWKSRLETPETADDFARKMIDTPKIVFTKTLHRSDWINTQLATGDLATEVTALKNQFGNDIMVYGGGTFVANLIKENLIDEFYLFINPAALGRGMPIFKELTATQNLTLVESIAFECGIVLLYYRPTA